jgi:hypothetical protein
VPRNPFEVLGLTPELVGELSEKELRVVLKAMYRTLQKTFHPDVSGPPRGKDGARSGGDRTVELNIAYETLDFDRDPAAFRSLRKSYLARQPSAAWRNSLLLRDRLEAQLESEDRLAANFFSYVAASAAPELEPPAPPRSAPLPAKGISLGLLDVAISNNLTQASWLVGSNYKQMVIDPEGRLSVKAVGRGRFSRANFIRLLGCVPVKALELLPLLERTISDSFREPPPRSGTPPKNKVLNLISLDGFKRHVLPLLSPLLLERAYLFSLNKAEFTKSGLVSVEGVIVKLDRLGEIEAEAS